MSRELPLSTLDADEIGELRATVRSVATEAGYPATVRDLEQSGTGLDEALWRVLAEDIGLAAVGLPEEVGGLGGLAELLAVAEELGASLAAVPFVSSTALAGQILCAAGSSADPWLERLAAGEVAGPAITDGRGTWSADAVTCTTDGSSVSGSVRFVPFGASAAFYVVAARGDTGIELMVVEADDASTTPLPSLDFSRPSATVAFDGATATRLAAGDEAIRALDHGVDVGLLAVVADQLGGSQHCFDATLDYVKLRKQFNREIGSFQAIKHRMADALMLVEMTRSGLERVTWSGTADLSSEASALKSWGSESYVAITAETIQLHGGVGFTWEHDAHLYFRRARYDAAFLGDAPFHKERLATLLKW